MKNAVHFGAGNIGRGFIGLILSKAGYHVTFIDVAEELVNDINNLKKYNVQIYGKDEKILVENVSAINSEKNLEEVFDAIVEADIVTTAIGAKILQSLAPVFAKSLEKRLQKNKSPLNIIACENIIGNSTLLKNFVYENLSAEIKSEVEKFVAFPNTTVDRIVPAQKNDEKLLIQVEEFFEWDIDKNNFIGEIPQIEDIHFVENLDAYIERKIFTVNTGHASTAYLGYLKNFRYIGDAIEDEEILNCVKGVWEESSAFLIDKYKFAPEVQKNYVEATQKRFENKFLYDEITRVARGPKRKLSPSDRIIFPANNFIALGKIPEHLAKVAAAALHFNFEGDKEAVEIQNFIQENGIDSAIENFTGAKKNSELFALIKKNF